MNIAKIFCQSLGVNPHAKCSLKVWHFRTDSRSNAFANLAFVWTARAIRSKKRMSSVRMAWATYIFSQKMSSVWTACAIHSNGLGYPFGKKLSSVRTPWAIHLKKIVIRSNRYGYPFKNEIVDHLCYWSYLFKINFSRVSIPKQFRHYFASNDLLFLSGHATKVVYKYIMNTVTDLCSFVAIFAFIPSFNYRQYQCTFYSIFKGFLQQVSWK